MEWKNAFMGIVGIWLVLLSAGLLLNLGPKGVSNEESLNRSICEDALIRRQQAEAVIAGSGTNIQTGGNIVVLVVALTVEADRRSTAVALEESANVDFWRYCRQQ